MTININKFGKLRIALDTLGLNENYTVEELENAYNLKKNTIGGEFINDAYQILTDNLNKDKNLEKQDKHTIFQERKEENSLKFLNYDEIHANIMVRLLQELEDDEKKLKCLMDQTRSELRNYHGDSISYFTKCNIYDAIKRYLKDPSFKNELIKVDVFDAIDYFSKERCHYVELVSKEKGDDFKI